MRSFDLRAFATIATVFVILTSTAAEAGHHARYFRAAMARCDAYAQERARWESREGQIATGTLLGALAGFGIGSIFAASGVGAAIGAPVGLAVGAAVRRDYGRNIWVSAYDSCMAGRAY